MKHILSVTVLIVTLYLGIYQDHLALWDSAQPHPEKVYPYHISLYPEIDRSALEKGIEITSKAQLSQLIEDFLS